MRALTFGGVPHSDDAQTRLHLAEMCKALGDQTQMEIRPHRSPSPAALAAAFGRDRVQLAWVSPTLFVMSSAFQRAIPLVSAVRQGRVGYHCVLFVGEDAPIQTVADLTGKRAAWVAQTSASGYIIPRLALAARGLDPRSMFADEAFYDTHTGVAEAVARGEADVGATFAVFEGGDASRRLTQAGFLDVDGVKARVLHASGPIPSDLVVASIRVPAAVRTAVIEAFTTPAEPRRLGELTKALFGAEAYQRFDPKSLVALRRDVQSARRLGLLPA